MSTIIPPPGAGAATPHPTPVPLSVYLTAAAVGGALGVAIVVVPIGYAIWEHHRHYIPPLWRKFPCTI